MDDMTNAPVPRFATISVWCAISGMGRRDTYEKLGLGLLRAVKNGSRTLIDVPFGLEFLRSLPVAKIKPSPQARARAAKKEERGK